MAITAERDYRELMAKVATRTNAARQGRPAVKLAELDRQVKAFQVRRDLGKLAQRAAYLPTEDRAELAAYLAAQLGVAALRRRRSPRITAPWPWPTSGPYAARGPVTLPPCAVSCPAMSG